VRTLGILLFTLILSGFPAARCVATVYHSNGSKASVQALHNAAHDGDTITLPAGTFSWTTMLLITKGITIQGQTTVTGPASNPVVNDLTVIQDNTPRSGSDSIIRTRIRAGRSFRLTGVTFAAGSTPQMASNDGAVQLGSYDSAPCTSMRIDHCHFATIYQGKMILVRGWTYGVADHNVLDCSMNGQASFHFWEDQYGGTSQINGNGAWADYPWYGTEKFFFVEDNRINGPSGHPSACDAFFGGRFVMRHNYFHNSYVLDHGTEGGAQRGVRAKEVYDNTFEYTSFVAPNGQRSGTSIWHDNTFMGTELNDLLKMATFRETPARSNTVWGIADGTCIWDQNDTEGNGTYIESHAYSPHLFDSGTDTSSVNSQGLVHDSTKHWTTNQWVGYSVKNTSMSPPLGSYIISNTSNTLTYFYYSANDTPYHMVFNQGDHYEIHRVLTMMDQNGRGKADQVRGDPNPINSTTGTPFWTHQQAEPLYAWNNVYTPNGRVKNIFTPPGLPTSKAGVDYFNLGAGLPAHMIPNLVKSMYVAARNGVDFTSEYIYPHPLASGAPTDNDGHPDYVLYNSSTRQTAIWYLNNNVLAGSAPGPTLPAGWQVVAVADFNLDGHPDYLLFNASTLETVIWYMNNNIHVTGANGPTLPAGWQVVAVADFNLDGHPDYLLFNASTLETVIWYMNNNVNVTGAYGPTLPAGWSVVAIADFNRDGHPDYLLFNSATRETVIWYMNNNVHFTGAYGPTLSAGWSLVGATDFNCDGKLDYLLFNSATRDTVIWYMNNNVHVTGAYGPTLSAGWSLVAP
jgi:elongation factor P hydroxylase